MWTKFFGVVSCVFCQVSQSPGVNNTTSEPLLFQREAEKTLEKPTSKQMFSIVMLLFVWVLKDVKIEFVEGTDVEKNIVEEEVK